MAKDITTKKENVPADMSAWDDYAGAGYEDTSSEDYAIPMVYVLQALSPACQDGDAKPGQIYISGLDSYIEKDKGLRFLPVTTRHNFVEWIPKDQGGGLVGQYPSTDPIVLRAKSGGEFGRLKSEEGNDLVETFYVYALAFPGEDPIEDTQPIQIVIPITSTKIKPYKNWRARLRQQVLPSGKPFPLFAHVSVLTTIQKENQHGKFYSVGFEYDGASAVEARLDPASPLLRLAKEFGDAINEGAVKVDLEAGRENAEGDSAKEAPAAGTASDEVPM